MKSQPNFPSAQVLLGWIGLCLEKIATDGEAEVDRVLSANKKDVDALLVKSKYYEKEKKYAQALELLNQIIVSSSWFSPALTGNVYIFQNTPFFN